MNLELRPSLEIKMEPKLKLSIEQKQQLEHILSLLPLIRHPEFPDAARGLEGMMDADKTLKDKNAFGVLIGGLSIDSWRKTSRKKLRDHKDVDVMVLDPERNFDQFEKGVDWWLPEQFGKQANDLVWVNGNNVELNFVVRYQSPRCPSGIPHRLGPGLYIPDPHWVVNATKLALMRQYEVENPDEAIDEEVAGALEEKMEKMFSKKALDAHPQFEALCEPVKSSFDNTRILSYESSSWWYPGQMPKPVALIRPINKAERAE